MLIPQDVLNISSVLTDGASAIVDDSFLRCFTSTSPDPWNWNFYLMPAWLLGLLFRYLILFPLRFVMLILSLLLFLAAFFAVRFLLPDTPLRHSLERRLIAWECGMFAASWTGARTPNIGPWHLTLPCSRGCLGCSGHRCRPDLLDLLRAILYLHALVLQGPASGFLWVVETLNRQVML